MGEKPFACEKCKYRTSDHNSLRRHKMQHSGVRPYRCPYCDYASIQSTTFKVHLKDKHPGLGKYRQ
ncbi:Zinc finger protein 407 [Portunus trituberculatus]|uniref:Zinc finger protein 407 n=1 Tax=Portunus trituberculatus TaxID=210409 RepID=A0A5B7HAI6_PORTR|nr:Zinc finger protein 407 [Portunus trituberculatus]